MRAAILVAIGVFLASPPAARAATVSSRGPDPDPTGHGEDFPPAVDVTDRGKHRNELEVRVSKRAVLVVERRKPPLKAQHGCRRRSTHVVICRVTDPYTTVYVDAGGGDDIVRSRCASSEMYTYGGSGNDLLASGDCGAWMWGGKGNDTLVGGRYAEREWGGAGADRLFGGGGDDVLYGDGFWRHRGNDVIDGGSGRDTAAWDERGDGIRADLRRGFAIGPRDRDRLKRIENLAGTTGNDVLAGNRRSNHLLGSYGRDLLIGRAGNDVLDGGIASPGHQDTGDRRADRFSCGAGRDLIRFPERSALPIGCDRMTTDFGETIAVRPRAAGAHSVAVPVICDDSLDTCLRHVVVRDGRRVIGQSRVVDDPPPAVRVRLSAPARRLGAATIVVTGNDGYRFSWRLACRGAPRRDVCRIGGR